MLESMKSSGGWWVVIEGNIGAGKTTLFNSLKKEASLSRDSRTNKIFFLEEFGSDLDSGRNELMLSLLDSFYKGGVNLMQFYVQLTNFKAMRASRDKLTFGKCIMDRSFLSEIVFRDVANLGEVQNAVLRELYDTFCSILFEKRQNYEKTDLGELASYEPLFKYEMFPKNTLFIFLATPLDTCMENIKKRGRTNEMNISLNYLEEIDISLGLLEAALREVYGDKVFVVDYFPTLDEILNQIDPQKKKKND